MNRYATTQAARRVQRPGITIPGHAARLLAIPLVIVVAAGLVAAGIAPFFAGVGQAVKRFDDQFLGQTATSLEIGDFPERSTIFAADGSVLATVAQYNRVSVPLDQVNEDTRNAVLAMEDDGFYEHPAVDFSAIVRAAIANLKAGEVVQGGSTITQQLVKNTYTGNEQTFARKFQEAQDAIRLERTYSKDQIFEKYLNEVYLGNGTYGIEAAAEFYFARHVSELTLWQAATLAGMISGPEDFDPIDHPEAALAQRNIALGRMLHLGWISQSEYLEAVAKRLKLSKKMRGVNKLGPEPYFVDYVRQLILDPPKHSPWFDRIVKSFGDTRAERERLFYQGGLKIYTTLDPVLQAAAREAVSKNIRNQGKAPPKNPESALVSIWAKSGAIQAMYGGEDFSEEQFNLATQSQRQAGSSFKAFTLAGAFEQGFPPGKVYKSNSPVEIPQDKCPNTQGAGPWMPSNAEPGGGGFMNLWTATAASVNVVFAQLIADVGPEPVVDVAYRMGVHGPNDVLDERGIHPPKGDKSGLGVTISPVCSITLGAVAVNPLAMTSGFATLANNGVHCEPFAITRVLSRSGKVLMKTKPKCQTAIEPDIAAQVTALLEGVMQGSGTGWRARLADRPAAGKTGTSQDHADLWFMGYVPQIATGVWVGYSKDEKTEIPSTLDIFNQSKYPGHGSGAFGGSIGAPIWHDFMVEAVKGLPVKGFAKPPPEKAGTVPNVVGLKQKAAEERLVEASYTPQVKEKDSSEPKGIVVEQSPGGGSSLRLGSIVTIYVSTGVSPKVTVPNVVGLTEAEATRVLTSAGFRVVVVYVEAKRPKNDGRVVGQDPAPGVKRDEGSVVTIAVGVLAEPAPLPSPSPSPSPG